MAALLGRQIEELNNRMEEIDAKLANAHNANAVSQGLATIPGVGPATALMLAIEIGPSGILFGPPFRRLGRPDTTGTFDRRKAANGRQLPGGDRAVACFTRRGRHVGDQRPMRPGGTQMTDWLRALLQRKPRKFAAVPLANKMARLAWALMTSGESYRRSLAAVEVVAA